MHKVQYSKVFKGGTEEYNAYMYISTDSAVKYVIVRILLQHHNQKLRNSTILFDTAHYRAEALQTLHIKYSIVK